MWWTQTWKRPVWIVSVLIAGLSKEWVVGLPIAKNTRRCENSPTQLWHQKAAEACGAVQSSHQHSGTRQRSVRSVRCGAFISSSSFDRHRFLKKIYPTWWENPSRADLDWNVFSSEEIKKKNVSSLPRCKFPMGHRQGGWERWWEVMNEFHCALTPSSLHRGFRHLSAVFLF